MSDAEKKAAMSAAELDAMLEGELDDLEDLPSFEPFPAGVHKVKLELLRKEINGVQNIEAKCTLIETIELAEAADPDAVPMKEGSVASTAYNMDNEFGRGAFKAMALGLAEQMGTTKLSQIIENTKGGYECAVVTGVRPDKDDKTKKYFKIIKVLPA